MILHPFSVAKMEKELRSQVHLDLRISTISVGLLGHEDTVKVFRKFLCYASKSMDLIPCTCLETPRSPRQSHRWYSKQIVPGLPQKQKLSRGVSLAAGCLSIHPSLIFCFLAIAGIMHASPIFS